MNSQELETAVRLEIPAGHLGLAGRWVRRHSLETTSPFRPNLFRGFRQSGFRALCESFGAVGYRVTAPTELRPILEQALQQDVPAVIDCPVDDGENLRLTKRLQALPVLQ